MTLIEARNSIIVGLENFVNCPVILAGQATNLPDFPYCYYSILESGILEPALGLYGLDNNPDVRKLKRFELLKAEISFNFCSQNRETAEGFIFGEDEALNLSQKAHQYFIDNSHNICSEVGEVVVINNISSIINRSEFLVDESLRKFGFDITFSYPVNLEER